MSSFLIADDSHGKIALLQGMLLHTGWPGEILVAMTTEEAMDLIDTNDIGFAFVDYYIPSANGPAVIAYLKSKNPAARIALVSSVDKKANNDEAKTAGAEVTICSSNPLAQVEDQLENLLLDWRSPLG